MPLKLSPAQLRGDAPHMAPISRDDAIYLAALVDGEGTVTLRTHTDRPFPYASITVYNTHKPLMDWLATLGGAVHSRRPIIRTDGGPTSTKPMYFWMVHRLDDVIYLLRTLRPFMRIKNERADQVIASISEERIWDTSRWSPPIWRGESSPNAKLTEVQVREIRASTAPSRVVGRLFGVNGATVRRIRRRKAWAHVV